MTEPAWRIPTPDGECALHLAPGGRTVVVGANGVGKSALGYWLQANAPDSTSVRRVIAHRKIWLESGGSDISAAERDQVRTNLAVWEQQADSRWLDHANRQRPSIALFDLLAADAARNRNVADALVQRPDWTARELLKQIADSPVEELNQALTVGGFGCYVRIGSGEAVELVHGDGRAHPIATASDGEKSAVLLASELLCAPSGSIQIIDEPERHLHRSVSAPLIRALLARRDDCHIVLLTHDLELAGRLMSDGAQTLALTGCEWGDADDIPTAWDLAEVNAEVGALPEAVRLAVLGGRTHVAFVEGTASSLDIHLYQLLLPGWTVRPTGGCSEVIRSVKGLQAAASLHWMRAAGVVDGDDRDEAEVGGLREAQVYPLDVNEIESLYLNEHVLRALAARQAPGLDTSTEDLMDSAVDAGLSQLKADQIDHLARGRALRRMQRQATSMVITRDSLDAAEPVVVEVPNLVEEESERLKGLVEQSDFTTIVRLYAIRDSRVPGAVAAAMGFRHFAQMAATARSILATDSQLLSQVRAAAGALPEDPAE